LELDMLRIAANPRVAVAAFYHALTGRRYGGSFLPREYRFSYPFSRVRANA